MCGFFPRSFDNPVFASIELDYADVDADPTGAAANEASKMIVFYELDLGLNHVVRSRRVLVGPLVLVHVPLSRCICAGMKSPAPVGLPACCSVSTE